MFTVIVSLRSGSVAANLGFQAGDIVQKVGRMPIATLADLEKALVTPQRLWVIIVKRGDQVLQFQVPG